MIKENGHTNLTNIYKYYNYNLHIVYVASCNNLLTNPKFFSRSSLTT